MKKYKVSELNELYKNSEKKNYYTQTLLSSQFITQMTSRLLFCNMIKLPKCLPLRQLYDELTNYKLKEGVDDINYNIMKNKKLSLDSRLLNLTINNYRNPSIFY